MAAPALPDPPACLLSGEYGVWVLNVVADGVAAKLWLTTFRLVVVAEPRTPPTPDTHMPLGLVSDVLVDTRSHLVLHFVGKDASAMSVSVTPGAAATRRHEYFVMLLRYHLTRHYAHEITYRPQDPAFLCPLPRPFASEHRKASGLRQPPHLRHRSLTTNPLHNNAHDTAPPTLPPATTRRRASTLAPPSVSTPLHVSAPSPAAAEPLHSAAGGASPAPPASFVASRSRRRSLGALADVPAAPSSPPQPSPAGPPPQPLSRESSARLNEYTDGGRTWEDGWQWFDLQAEYARQGVDTHAAWRVVDNSKYQFCKTYPPWLVVPAATSQVHVEAVARFRSKGRLPVLTHLCTAFPDAHGGCPAILRAAQPLVGLRGRRSGGDEAMLRAANVSAIMDCRPALNALGNRAMGKGYELVQHYSVDSFVHLGIENIHVVRTSLQRFVEAVAGTRTTVRGDSVLQRAMPSAITRRASRAAVESPSPGAASATSPAAAASATAPTSPLTPGAAHAGAGAGAGVGAADELGDEDQWLSKVEASKWLKHLQSVLAGSNRVVHHVAHVRKTVLVHCSDGWDRTAQVCALSQLCIDPFFRTLRGFAVLIEKDWCSFGYQFEKRCGQGQLQFHDQQSPILLCQFPDAFEFNSRLLSELCIATYSGQFGTFLYDTDAARRAADVERRTVSVWTLVARQRRRFIHPGFTPTTQVLAPATGLRSLRLWPHHYRTFPALAASGFGFGAKVDTPVSIALLGNSTPAAAGGSEQSRAGAGGDSGGVGGGGERCLRLCTSVASAALPP